ncbi:hypothetical protein GCM10010104_44010 [Streptomyces indiaensis]|uniref:Uncharacterized protein n=1 Tax=Streptomyces indiaensis TaxID=284033 RepID=A0ABN3DXP6_9ACTN
MRCQYGRGSRARFDAAPGAERLKTPEGEVRTLARGRVILRFASHGTVAGGIRQNWVQGQRTRR